MLPYSQVATTWAGSCGTPWSECTKYIHGRSPRPSNSGSPVAREIEPVPLHLRPLHAGGDPHHPPGEHAEPGHGGVLLGRLEQHLHADADAEERPPGVDGVERRLLQPGASQRRHAPAEGTHARQHDGVGVGDQPVVGGETGVGAHVRQRLLGRAQVADPVVEHGHERARPAVAAQHALGGRHPGALDAHGVAQAAGQALERRLDDVVDVAAAPQRDVQGDAGRGGEAVHGVLGQLRVERRVAEREASRQLDLPHHERPARQIERHLHQRLVERVQAAGEAAHAGLVAERLPEGLAQSDGDVLDRVVAVDVQIALGLDREVEAAVAAELVEHVVVERQAGADGCVAPAVEVDGTARSSSPWSTRWRVAVRAVMPIPLRRPPARRRARRGTRRSRPASRR